jgi:hypothetical protein
VIPKTSIWTTAIPQKSIWTSSIPKKFIWTSAIPKNSFVSDLGESGPFSEQRFFQEIQGGHVFKPL